MEFGRFKTENESQTVALAQKFAEGLTGGEVVAFFGTLGMGKTAFVRGMAKGLGIDESVSSPTYALVHEYEGRINLYHFDMYRVDGWDDLYSTGFFEYLEMGGVVAVEWSENIENALPDDTIFVTISVGENENERIIEIERGRGQ
ncbi:MAG: tRNA (adenosine(37)-N6)-threonylcarbamoyltransferase complex ATPase subunit type 1 TsaE [Clostridia bacterium]|nr:tRNA (adenosine(37)-N6)-threonylcarbamoyltransferase complex ATPase subunit type 1 TsaE [Clostridia bacterium]